MHEEDWRALQAAASSRLRELRMRANLTQQALADDAGVSRAVVQRIEQGSGSPGLRQLWQLAQTLDTTIEEILRREPAHHR